MAVSSVSFTKTPQAGDDNYNLLEDSITTYTVDGHQNVMSLDVMSNDLGGNAKKLYSIDDGNGNPLAPDTQLLTKDVGSNGVSAWEATEDGNLIRINNGKIELDLTHSLTALGATNVNSLAAGDVIDDTFVYTIQLGNGTLSQAVVHIHLEGQNDAASISGTDTGDLTEDGIQTAAGTLTVVDVDHGQSHTQAVTAVAHNSDSGLGSYSVDADGHWSYTVDNSLIQHLGANDTTTDTFVVKSLDGTAEETVTVTIHGVNDDATISAAGIQDTSVTEDSLTDNTAGGTLQVSDVDDGQNTFDVADGGSHAGTAGHGTFTFDATTGVWGYTLNNLDPALDALNAGDTLHDTYTVHSADGTDSYIIDVTINGADDVVTPPAGNPPAPPVFTDAGDPNDFDDLVNTPVNNTANANSDNNPMYGGAGNDTLNGDTSTSVIDHIYGGTGDDTINLKAGGDIAFGGSGSDTISGDNGDDQITGGYGADQLNGGGGNDNYVYLDVKDTGDTISGWDSGDTIDFSALFGGTLGFVAADSGATVVANSVTWTESGGNTIISVDTTGDTTADLQITLTGVGFALTAADFHL